ncbi:MAG: leucyl aminopeptidase [Bacteroidia bacterium]
MNLHLLSTLPATPPAALILPYLEDAIDWTAVQAATGLDLQGEFKGQYKEVLTVYVPGGGRKVLLMGLGKAQDLPRAAQAFRSLAFQHQSKWGQSLTLDLRHLPEGLVLEAALGLHLATYQPGLFKTGDTPQPALAAAAFEVQIIHTAPEAKALAAEARHTAATQAAMMRLVDSPANKKTPQDLAAYAQDSARQHGYEATVLDREALQREGLHALLAVGQGSPCPPVLICLRYCPPHLAGTRPQIGLAGKGVTFDTGGISIKGSNNMHYMKSDMGGAAAVLGAVELAARLRLGLHVVGVIPATENSVDALSIRPGDVIGSYAGKTIEVIDTDAEGRLILADALAYLVAQYDPEVLIDLATLTGSCVQTLGYTAAGLFSNDDALAEALAAAGRQVYERVWRLPLWADYEADLHSDLADLRNFSGKPVAGAITAAKFLERFTSGHPRWAHLDIAGVAFGDSEFAKMRSATGYGVRLLRSYMATWAGGGV